MKNNIIFLGKVVTLSVWIVMFWNLVHPFASPLNVVINGALLFIVITHGLQVWLYTKTMTQQERQEGGARLCWRLFLFGIFESLSWKKQS